MGVSGITQWTGSELGIIEGDFSVGYIHVLYKKPESRSVQQMPTKILLLSGLARLFNTRLYLAMFNTFLIKCYHP